MCVGVPVGVCSVLPIGVTVNGEVNLKRIGFETGIGRTAILCSLAKLDVVKWLDEETSPGGRGRGVVASHTCNKFRSVQPSM